MKVLEFVVIIMYKITMLFVLILSIVVLLPFILFGWLTGSFKKTNINNFKR